MTSEGQCLPAGPLTVKGIDAPTEPIGRQGRDAWSLTEARRPRPAVAVPGASTAQIRAWAMAHGFFVRRNGAIPAQVRDAYDRAAKTGAQR